MPESPEAVRFRQTVKLAEEGFALMRQNLRRRHPEASDDEIERLFEEWLVDRPMDAPGRVIPG